MALIVQKYGGTSVGDIERIKNVARRCIAAQQAGNDVVVVVSAMSGETNRLLKLVSQITDRPNEREQDVVVATGEQVSIGLVALAIQTQGGQATSFLGHQCRIITDSTFSKARIRSIDGERIFEALQRKHIAVIAGFQGVDEEGNITTLGRGGSDTTAVAIAAALKADACEIYTDVDGVYTADPRIVPTARRLERVSFEEMLELAACGAKILHLRCVEYGRRYDIPIHVRSSFSQLEGTWVVDPIKEGPPEQMEQAIIAGVAHDRSEAKITVVGVPDKVGEAARIFEALSAAEINLDMIVQNISAAATNLTDISFTLPRTDGQVAMAALAEIQEAVGFDSLLYDDEIGKVSLVGAGMRSHPGITASFFGALANAGINIEMISTSEIRISVIVDEGDVDAAVQATHSTFDLDSDEVEAVVYGGTGR